MGHRRLVIVDELLAIEPEHTLWLRLEDPEGVLHCYEVDPEGSDIEAFQASMVQQAKADTVQQAYARQRAGLRYLGIGWQSQPLTADNAKPDWTDRTRVKFGVWLLQADTPGHLSYHVGDKLSEWYARVILRRDARGAEVPPAVPSASPPGLLDGPISPPHSRSGNAPQVDTAPLPTHTASPPTPTAPTA